MYGAAYKVRRWIEEQALGYVLAVTGAQRFGLDRVAERAERIPADDWHRLSSTLRLSAGRSWVERGR